MSHPNIILVTIDSLRADRCGFMGYERDTTPFLSSVKKDGIVFKDFYANSVQTAFTFPVIMTGYPPFAWGNFLGVPPFVVSLPQYLQTRFGYRTIAVISSNPTLSSSYGYNRGFEEFLNYWRPSSFEKKLRPKVLNLLKEKIKLLPVLRNFRRPQKVLPDSKILLEKTLAILSSTSDEPVFLWIHLMDVHTPFNGYEGFSELYEPLPTHVLYDKMWKYFKNLVEIWEKIKSIPLDERTTKTILDITSNMLDYESLSIAQKIYDGAILTVDKRLGYLYEELSKKRINTFIVITSDHGEAFMEHGYPGHEPLGLHNELVKIPLTILSTTEQLGDKIIHPYSQVDLYRIITSLAKGKIDFETNQSNYVVIQIPMGSISPQYDIPNWYTPLPSFNTAYAVVIEGFKYIQHIGTSEYELYNLEEDPFEKKNISKDYPALIKKMQKVFSTYQSRIEKTFSSLRRTMFGYSLRTHLKESLNFRKTRK